MDLLLDLRMTLLMRLLSSSSSATHVLNRFHSLFQVPNPGQFIGRRGVDERGEEIFQLGRLLYR